MIKGQDIGSMVTIYDTTPGRLTVWIMVIMLFLLYLVYLFLLYKIEQVHIERFIKLKQEFQIALAQETKQGVPIRQDPLLQNRESLRKEDQEAMESFNNLKHAYRRW